MDQSISTKPRLTPKDFVLYLAAMIFLYTSVFSLLALLFEYINILFPDALQYIDPYSTGIRFSIATLIIIFPLYVFLTRVLNQDVRKNPEKRELGFRKWLMYITILAAGIGMAADLVALVNTYLGGEISNRFILKVLAVFVVAGSVFTYYLLDLKGYWEKNKPQAQLTGILALVLVFGSIIGGFAVMGSPTTQRLMRFDQQKISDLQSIQWQIINYWQAKQKLPESLEVLNDPLTGSVVPTDPQEGKAYTYSIVSTNDLSFKLCATFNRDGTVQSGYIGRDMSYPASVGIKGDESWAHSVGETCFTRTIDPDKFPPINAKPI